MICTTAHSYHRKRWLLTAQDEDTVARLANELRMPPVIARLLVNRGLFTAGDATAFLDSKFNALHPPSLLPGIDNAATLIADAIRSNKKITLYGDYDVDGITGTTMLWHTLKEAGANVDYYIPHRVDEGYGLNIDAIKQLAETGTQLLISIDCGGSAIEPIAIARSLGMDVVVSDHHELPPTLPDANAIVHPRLPGSHMPYPNPDLCGAGVAFKLAWAIAQKLCNSERVSAAYKNLLMEFMALAALGTIADVVPLVGENRILVKHGLAQVARTTIPGLLAFIHAAGYGEGGRKLDTTAVGFTLAPRLNAAGRMGHAREAVELLTTATGARADEIATYLESQNRERQAKERKMVEIAKSQITERFPDLDAIDHVLVVSHETFHAGIVGIVASRLVDTFHRPAFVLANNGEECHGSARSIAGFELHHAIDHARDLLLSGGGHAMAGGVKLLAMHLDAFRERVNELARTRLDDDALIPNTKVDGTLTLNDCRPEVIQWIEKLEPFGRGNPQPRFLVENIRISAPPRRVGATGSHLQLTISNGTKTTRCIAFKLGPLEPQLPVGTDIDLIVEPKLDEYNGITRVDLSVHDIARTDKEPFART